MLIEHRRFGLTYVNFTTLERFPKASALWYSKFAAENADFGLKTPTNYLNLLTWGKIFLIYLLLFVIMAIFWVTFKEEFVDQSMTETESLTVPHTIKEQSYFQIDNLAEL